MKKMIIGLFFVLSGVALAAQNTIDLKLAPEKGRVYRFKSTNEQIISQTMNGVQQNTTVHSLTVVSLKMVESTPDFIVAEVRFDTINSTNNAMGKVTDIRSSNEGNMASSDMSEVMSCVMNRLSKNPLYVKMDYTGKVMELINTRMLSGILLKDTASVTGATASVIRAQLAGAVEEKALKTMVEMFTGNLPGTKVKAGDTWSSTTSTTSGGMSLDIITGFRLVRISDNQAVISAESNIQPSAHAVPMNYGGAKVSYDELKGLGKTEMTVDSRTGLVIESSSRTQMAGTLHISVQNTNIDLPMEISGESKMIALP